MKKNVGSQLIGAQMVSATDGTAFTGTATVVITGDGGTQSASGGTGPTHEGNGYHSYIPTQAETNFGIIAFTFTGSGAIPVTVQVFTTFPQTVDNATGIADIPTVSEFNARTLVAASYFDPAADAVANVTLVGTTTTNTDMVGTDNAALATALATAQLDLDTITGASGVNLLTATQASIDAIELDTNELQGDWANGGRLDLLIDAIKVITDALTAEAAANLAKTMSDEGAISATASGTPTTTTIPASNLGSSVDDFYNSTVMIVLTGTLAGQRTDVTDYVGSTKTLTVTAMTSALSSSDTFILL